MTYASYINSYQCFLEWQAEMVFTSQSKRTWWRVKGNHNFHKKKENWADDRANKGEVRTDKAMVYITKIVFIFVFFI